MSYYGFIIIVQAIQVINFNQVKTDVKSKSWSILTEIVSKSAKTCNITSATYRHIGDKEDQIQIQEAPAEIQI